MMIEQADEGYPVRIEVEAFRVEADDSGLTIFDAYGLTAAKVDFLHTRFSVKTLPKQ